MIQELFTFITQRWDFLLPLIYEHLQISAIAIVFATIVGVSVGILIAEKRKASSLTLGVISFLYTIPSISMLGFLIPVTGIGNTCLLYTSRQIYGGMNCCINAAVYRENDRNSTPIKEIRTADFQGMRICSPP